MVGRATREPKTRSFNPEPAVTANSTLAAGSALNEPEHLPSPSLIHEGWILRNESHDSIYPGIGAIAAALFACPSWLRRSSNSCRSACRLGEASLLARYLSPPS